MDAVPIADIAYTAPSTASSLTLQIVANSSLYRNTSISWGNLTVSLPTTYTAVPNPVPGLLPV
jgi:hypothetical protein